MQADRFMGADGGREWASRWLPLVLLLVIVAGTFSNSFRNGFHLDDFYRIRDNPEIRRVSPVLRHFTDPGTISGSRGISESPLNQIGQYRPLLPLSLSLNYAGAGHSLAGYHAVNLGLHLAGCLLVFLFVAAILGSARAAGVPVGGGRWAAFVVALVYGVHPLSGYPVNYILARDLLLMQAFLLGSLTVYARAGQRLSAWRWVTALGLFELALLSKVTAVVAPVLVLAFEWTIASQGLRTWRPWKRAAPFAAVVAGHLALARLFLDFGDVSRVEGGWSWSYALTQADVHVTEYLKNFVWPAAIRMAPEVIERTSLTDSRVLLGLAVVAASLALALRLRRKAPVAAFAVLGYWALMMPESSVFPISHYAVHYRAFPSSWLLYLALALAVSHWLRPRLALSLGVAVAAALALTSFSMNRIYRTEESLWSHSVRHGGEALAHMNYAMSLPDRADPRVKEHLDTAVEMSPTYVLAHVNLGLLTMDLGQPEAGLARLRDVAAMAPDWPDARYWLSVAYDRVGEIDAAAAEAAAAAALDPGNLQVQYRLALARSRAVEFGAALTAARRVLDVDPEHADARFVEAYALQMTGKAEAAAVAYRRYLISRPDDLEARFNLAYAWVSMGECSLAEPELEAVLRVDPNHPGATEYRTVCRDEARGGIPAARSALQRQYAAALATYRAADYRRSLEFVQLVEAIDPGYAETRFLKGFDLQMLGRLEEAVEAYESYLTTRPDEAQVHFNVAHALMTLGRCGLAIPHFERTIELHPHYVEARRHLEACRADDAKVRAAGLARSAINDG